MDRFTAFEKLDLELCSGINVFVGPNGTGKTHLMKVAYSACDVSKNGGDIAEKLLRVFMPTGGILGRLVKRRRGSSRATVEVYRGERRLRVSFSNRTRVPKNAKVSGAVKWSAEPVDSVYIPVKEMLSNAPGFLSLYSQREVHFEEVYADILARAYRPVLRGAPGRQRRRLLAVLDKAMKGNVVVKEEEFFLNSRQGSLEFSLVAEGVAKLALLALLIRNGTLLRRSVLFWDEPETNIHPKLFGPVVEVLLQLQRGGDQVFIATHSYVILKELDLRSQKGDQVVFHSFYRDESSGRIRVSTAREYLAIHPNVIQETFLDLYDRDVRRELGD